MFITLPRPSPHPPHQTSEAPPLTGARPGPLLVQLPKTTVVWLSPKLQVKLTVLAWVGMSAVLTISGQLHRPLALAPCLPQSLVVHQVMIISVVE